MWVKLLVFFGTNIICTSVQIMSITFTFDNQQSACFVFCYIMKNRLFKTGSFLYGQA